MTQSGPDPAHSHVLDTFLDDQGRIVVMPAKRAKRIELLEHILQTLPRGTVMDVGALNARLRPFTEDVAMLRRYLVEYGLLDRPQPATYQVPDRAGVTVHQDPH